MERPLKNWVVASVASVMMGVACWMFVGAGMSSSAAVPADERMRSEEGRREIENVLSWQTDAGGWPKNQPTTKERFNGDRQKLQGTFDNGATTTELRLLARAFRMTKDPRCEAAFLKGLRHILDAQYPSGGWPQYHPPPSKSYHRHITFNDGSMVRILELLRDVTGTTEFEFVAKETQERCGQAFERGIACVLKCQIVVDGVRTAWCAQHDEVTLEPRPGRTFELASLSGGRERGYSSVADEH